MHTDPRSCGTKAKWKVPHKLSPRARWHQSESDQAAREKIYQEVWNCPTNRKGRNTTKVILRSWYSQQQNNTRTHIHAGHTNKTKYKPQHTISLMTTGAEGKTDDKTFPTWKMMYLKDLVDSSRELLHLSTLSIQLQETRSAFLYNNTEFAEKKIRGLERWLSG